MSVKQNKRGAISKKEEEYLRKNYKTLSPAEIAEDLGRTEETVKQWIINLFKYSPDDEISQEEIERKAVEKELQTSPEWTMLKDEFTDNELRYFKHRYVKLMAQFREDVYTTEETQIFTLIKYEILKHRNLAETKKTSDEIDRLDKMIADEYAKYDSITDMDPNTKAFVMNLENQLLAAKAARNAKSTEYNNLSQREAAILKDLKATREQRITKIADIQGTLLDTLKSLQQEDVQAREGRHMELVRLAAEKEKQRLMKPHKYVDGVVDQPLLLPENVIVE